MASQLEEKSQQVVTSEDKELVKKLVLKQLSENILKMLKWGIINFLNTFKK